MRLAAFYRMLLLALAVWPFATWTVGADRLHLRAPRPPQELGDHQGLPEDDEPPPYPRSERLQSRYTIEKVPVLAGFRYGSNGLNLGIGIHGGYVLAPGIYVGGLFDYYFGGTRENEVEGYGEPATLSQQAWLAAFEGGYDLRVDRLVVRPVLTLGMMGVSREACLGAVCQSESYTHVSFSAGSHLWYMLSTTVSVGSELRLRFGRTDGFVLGVNACVLLL